MDHLEATPNVRVFNRKVYREEVTTWVRDLLIEREMLVIMANV